jgi:hypothetical protein
MVDLRQCGKSSFYRVSCAARRILDHGDDAVRGIKPTGEIGVLSPDDEDAGIWPRAVSGPQHTSNHGDTGNGVQRFREQGPHAGACPGGKHDETNPFVLTQ